MEQGGSMDLGEGGGTTQPGSQETPHHRLATPTPPPILRLLTLTLTLFLTLSLTLPLTLSSHMQLQLGATQASLGESQE